jgi:norsolorinic acid ketoreductase
VPEFINMSEKQVYLITGANRGIGKAMVGTFLLRPNTVVVATVRDPKHETSQSLLELPVGTGSQIHVLTLDSATAASGFPSLAADLAGVGVDRLDVVIANAGTTAGFPPTLEARSTEPRDDFVVNALAPLELFRATWPLLKKDGQKKFVLITSSVGSIKLQETEPFPSVSYGMSKAAVNWMGKKISVEFKKDGLKVGLIHPGWVQTAMGQVLADAIGFKEPPMTVEDSARQVVEQIDKLTAETSGNFVGPDGKEIPW